MSWRTRKSVVPSTLWWEIHLIHLTLSFSKHIYQYFHGVDVYHVFFLLINPQNFYKSEVNKEDMYIRYIHKLCDLHLQAEDFTGNRDVGCIV